MPSISEVGHAKNVANFQDLIEFVIGYGPTYNPSKDSLKVPLLTALKATAATRILEVVIKSTAFNTKVNERMIAFSDIRSLSTRLLNALLATDAHAETIKDAKTINRKIQGKKAPSTMLTPTDPDAPIPTTISSSQQSYDQLIQHLTAFNELLKTELTYTPNEVDLQVIAIDTKVSDLDTLNTAVATAYTAISNERLARNATLYTDPVNLVDTAKEVKQYVKSVFGATSPQYKQISDIQIRKVPT